MKRAAFALALALLAGPALGQEPNSATGKVSATATSITAQALTVTIAAAGGQTMNYVCGFALTGGGATAAQLSLVTLTGVNGGTQNYTWGSVTGVALNSPPLIVTFTPCQPASAPNTALVLSVPTLGAGNVSVGATLWGYRASF